MTNNSCASFNDRSLLLHSVEAIQLCSYSVGFVLNALLLFYLSRVAAFHAHLRAVLACGATANCLHFAAKGTQQIFNAVRAISVDEQTCSQLGKQKPRTSWLRHQLQYQIK